MLYTDNENSADIPTKLSDEEIIKMAIRDIDNHLVSKEKWRNKYVKPAFAMYDGQQWTSDDAKRQENDEMPTRTINKIASVVDAVAGFEVQNRADIDCLPMAINSDPEYIETANNGIRWCENTSGFDYESSFAFQDLLKCGVGATVNYISYYDDPDGIMKTERVFPLLFLFDPASRRKNMKDARWLGYAEIVDADSAKKEAGIDDGEPLVDSIDDSRLLDYFDTLLTVDNLSIRYEYQWKETEKYWRVKNTLLDTIREIIKTDELKAQLLANYLQAISIKYGFDPKASIFSINDRDYSDIKKGFSGVGVNLNAVRQKRFNYFRVKILGGRIIEKGFCIQTDGFDIKPMTGKFSEIDQSHYGMIHSQIDAQRGLNQAISDFEGYLRTIPKGGVEIEATAVPDLQGFKDTWHKARDITVYSDGALSQGRVRPKQAGQMPVGITDMIQLMLRLIPELPGVTPDFMGVYDSAQEVSGILQAQRVRQGLTVLATYFDAKQLHSIDQGKLYLDGLRILAENSPGRLIRNVLGTGGEKFLSLRPESLASEYMVEVKPMAQTPDEQRDMFSKLMELGTMLENSSKTSASIANILPIALEYAPIKGADKEKIVASLAPAPAPQPDPVNQALLQAEANYKNSMASKNTADAKNTEIDNLLKIKELESYDDKVNAQVMEILSKAQLNNERSQNL